jgi:hypothetical protein
MRISTCLLVLLSVFLSAAVWAFDCNNSDESLLNRVSLRLTAEQWVSSKTALVTVSINAGVSDSALESIQTNVLKKLNELSNVGEWHITSFNRSLDQSGLEKVQMQAQARLPSQALPNLRNKAKALSKPGETFTLDDIQFTPSEEELREANMALRNNIYQQSKDELERLNKVYPEQKFYIHEINFLGNTPLRIPQNAMIAMKMGDNDMNNSLAVGDKLVLSATIVAAAIPNQALIKKIN